MSLGKKAEELSGVCCCSLFGRVVRSTGSCQDPVFAEVLNQGPLVGVYYS